MVPLIWLFWLGVRNLKGQTLTYNLMIQIVLRVNEHVFDEKSPR